MVYRLRRIQKPDYIMKVFLSKTSLVISSLIILIGIGQFVQCKSTKAGTRNTADICRDGAHTKLTRSV